MNVQKKFNCRMVCTRGFILEGVQKDYFLGNMSPTRGWGIDPPSIKSLFFPTD